MESNNQIRFCSYCGTKLDDGARFCKGCGKAVVQTTQATSESNTKGEPSNEVFSQNQILKEKLYMKANYISVRIAENC